MTFYDGKGFFGLIKCQKFSLSYFRLIFQHRRFLKLKCFSLSFNFLLSIFRLKNYPYCDNGVNNRDNSLLATHYMLAHDALVKSQFTQQLLPALAQNFLLNQLAGTGTANASLEVGTGGRGSRNGSNQNGHRAPSYQEEDLESSTSTDPYFEPIHKPRSQECSSPVDLHISGLDPYMSAGDAKNLLTNIFKMHVGVRFISEFETNESLELVNDDAIKSCDWP